MKDLSYYANLAATCTKPRTIECNLTLQVDDEKFHAYEVSIANCDLLFYCDKGTANYVVDTYGNQTFCELYDWEKEA